LYTLSKNTFVAAAGNPEYIARERKVGILGEKVRCVNILYNNNVCYLSGVL